MGGSSFIPLIGPLCPCQFGLSGELFYFRDSGQGVDRLAGAEKKKSKGVVMKSRHCEYGTSAAVLRPESRAFSF